MMPKHSARKIVRLLRHKLSGGGGDPLSKVDAFW